MTYTTEAQLLHWFAIRTKSNREAVVTEALKGRGLDAWCPRFASNGKSAAGKPVFPGYLFCRFSMFDRLPVLTVPGILNIVSNGKAPVPVDEKEMESLRVVVESLLPMTAYDFFQTGDKVMIVNGPLSGAQGHVVQRYFRHFVVSITLLQRAIAVTLKPEWLQKAA